jgi:hypothetical protein
LISVTFFGCCASYSRQTRKKISAMNNLEAVRMRLDG